MDVKAANAGDLVENVGDPRDRAPGACAGVAGALVLDVDVIARGGVLVLAEPLGAPRTERRSRTHCPEQGSRVLHGA